MTRDTRESGDQASSLFRSSNNNSSATSKRSECRIGEMFQTYNDALVRFLSSRLGPHSHNADDIAQECFVRLSRYDKPTISSAELRSLLYQIARNIMIDFHRHGKVVHSSDHVDIDDHELISPTPSQEQVLSAQEDLKRIERILMKLPTRCREVFVLSRFEEMKYDDIAKRCGISVSMVEKHIAKAMKSIKKR